MSYLNDLEEAAFIYRMECDLWYFCTPPGTPFPTLDAKSRTGSDQLEPPAGPSEP